MAENMADDQQNNEGEPYQTKHVFILNPVRTDNFFDLQDAHFSLDMVFFHWFFSFTLKFLNVYRRTIKFYCITFFHIVPLEQNQKNHTLRFPILEKIIQ